MFFFLSNRQRSWLPADRKSAVWFKDSNPCYVIFFVNSMMLQLISDIFWLAQSMHNNHVCFRLMEKTFDGCLQKKKPNRFVHWWYSRILCEIKSGDERNDCSFARKFYLFWICESARRNSDWLFFSSENMLLRNIIVLREQLPWQLSKRELHMCHTTADTIIGFWYKFRSSRHFFRFHSDSKHQ